MTTPHASALQKMSYLNMLILTPWLNLTRLKQRLQFCACRKASPAILGHFTLGYAVGLKEPVKPNCVKSCVLLPFCKMESSPCVLQGDDLQTNYGSTFFFRDNSTDRNNPNYR